MSSEDDVFNDGNEESPISEETNEVKSEVSDSILNQSKLDDYMNQKGVECP